MKTILIIFVVGGVCLLAGLFIGARVGHHQEIANAVNSHEELISALSQAGVLSVDVHIANDLHNGRVNGALDSVVSRIDASMVYLANRKTVAQANGPMEILYEESTLPALNFALAYRKTNSWMNNFGFIALGKNDPSGSFSNNIITSELQKLLTQ